MDKQVLLINDLAGYGKVALSAMIPVRFPGTGDIFSSALMGKVLAGEGLRESMQKAMDIVKEMIVKNRDSADKFKGIPVEACLELIDR